MNNLELPIKLTQILIGEGSVELAQTLSPAKDAKGERTLVAKGERPVLIFTRQILFPMVPLKTVDGIFFQLRVIDSEGVIVVRENDVEVTEQIELAIMRQSALEEIGKADARKLAQNDPEQN